jgi:hypothetical protein
MRLPYLMGCCQLGHLLLASGIFQSFLPEANVKYTETRIKETGQFGHRGQSTNLAKGHGIQARWRHTYEVFAACFAGAGCNGCYRLRGWPPKLDRYHGYASICDHYEQSAGPSWLHCHGKL